MARKSKHKSPSETASDKRYWDRVAFLTACAIDEIERQKQLDEWFSRKRKGKNQ